MNLMTIFMCNDSNNHTTFGKGWLASCIFHIICTRIMSITIAAEWKVGAKHTQQLLSLLGGLGGCFQKKFQNFPS